MVEVTINYSRTLTLNTISSEPSGGNYNAREFWKYIYYSRIIGKPIDNISGKLIPAANTARGIINSEHIFRYSYVINKSMEPDWQPAIAGTNCLVLDKPITLSVDKKYALFSQQWQTQGLDIIGSSTDDSVKIQSKETSNDYLYSVIYTVSDCKRSVSDTIIVGKNTPLAQISDSAFCIPIGENIFTDSIRNPSDKLSYYWQGVYVALAPKSAPPNTEQKQSKSQRVDLSDYKAGTYLFKFISDGGSSRTEKIVKL